LTLQLSGMHPLQGFLLPRWDCVTLGLYRGSAELCGLLKHRLPRCLKVGNDDAVLLFQQKDVVVHSGDFMADESCLILTVAQLPFKSFHLGHQLIVKIF
jgi:hypothetical protein